MPKKLHLQGPYALLSDNPRNLFKEESANGGGIYLWTFEGPDGFVIDYVGEATTVSGRMVDHLKAQLGGMYNIYDPDRMVKGERYNYWEGYHWKSKEQNRIVEFIERQAELVPHNQILLNKLRIFFAPIETTMRMRKRIESGIITELLKSEFYTKSIQNPPQVRWYRKDNEEAEEWLVTSNENIIGLNNMITI